MPEARKSILDKLADLSDDDLKEAFNEVRRHRSRRKITSIFAGAEDDEGDDEGEDEGGQKRSFFGN